MLRKLLESLSIIGGAVLALYPVLGDSGMNTAQWVSVGIGSALIIGGVISQFLRKEQTLREKNAELVRRSGYLPNLRTLTKERLFHSERLKNEASELSFNEYRDKFLKDTWQYRILHWWFKQNEDQAILSALSWTRFMYDNLYYALLKENDPTFKQLMPQYQTALAENKDKKLNKEMKRLWFYERWVSSMQIFALLSKNNPKIRNIPSGIRLGTRGQNRSRDVIETQLRKALNRMTELENGEDL